jgi:hypothetical protein
MVGRKERERERERERMLAHLGFLIFAPTFYPSLQAWRMVHSGQVLSFPLVNSFWTFPYIRTQRCALLILQASFHPFRLTIKIIHHSSIMWTSPQEDVYFRKMHFERHI